MREPSSGNRRGPLVRKGSGAAHALSATQRVAALRRVTGRLRRRLYAEGREADPMVVLLINRLEERLDAAEVTAETLLTHLLEHAPAPRDESDDAWLCVNPACRVPLYGMRADAETCGSACRSEVYRLRRAGLLPPRAVPATRST